MQTLGGIAFVALVVLPVVLALKKFRRDIGALGAVLSSLEGQWATVEIGGMGGRIGTIVTLTGGVERVEDGRLYLDGRSMEPTDLQRVLLGPGVPDKGIPLERIRSVRGPRGTVSPGPDRTLGIDTYASRLKAAFHFATRALIVHLKPLLIAQTRIR